MPYITNAKICTTPTSTNAHTIQPCLYVVRCTTRSLVSYRQVQVRGTPEMKRERPVNTHGQPRRTTPRHAVRVFLFCLPRGPLSRNKWGADANPQRTGRMSAESQTAYLYSYLYEYGQDRKLFFCRYRGGIKPTMSMHHFTICVPPSFFPGLPFLVILGLLYEYPYGVQAVFLLGPACCMSVFQTTPAFFSALPDIIGHRKKSRAISFLPITRLALFLLQISVWPHVVFVHAIASTTTFPGLQGSPRRFHAQAWRPLGKLVEFDSPSWWPFVTRTHECHHPHSGEEALALGRKSIGAIGGCLRHVLDLGFSTP
jgi:hypothetical protein